MVLFLSPAKKGSSPPKKSIPRWLCGCSFVGVHFVPVQAGTEETEVSGSVLLHNAFIQRCTGVPFHHKGSHVWPQLWPSPAASSPAKLRQGGWHLDVLASFQFLLAVNQVIDPINDNLDQLHLQQQEENCGTRGFSSSVNGRVGSWLVLSPQQTKLKVRRVTDITPPLAQGVHAVQSHSNSLLLLALSSRNFELGP